METRQHTWCLLMNNFKGNFGKSDIQKKNLHYNKWRESRQVIVFLTDIGVCVRQQSNVFVNNIIW